MYHFSDILSAFPADKKKADGTISRFIHRPLSWPLTWFFLNTGWTANGVTWLSIVVCLFAFVFSLVPFLSFHIAAVALYFLFGTLDCVDGNMARTIRARTIGSGLDQVVGKGPHIGEWVDALGGYTAYTCLLLSMGMSSLLVSPHALPGLRIALPYGEALWPFIASVCCASNLLMRLAFQSWRVASGETSRSSVGTEKRFSEEVGVAGWMQVLYGLSLLLGLVPWLLLAYTALYGAGCVFSLLKLAKRAGS